VKAVLILAVLAGMCSCDSSHQRYPVAFTNDVKASVIVTSCEACGDGRLVQPGETWHLSMTADERLRVNEQGRARPGCVYLSKSASTSRAARITASFALGAICK
jgi:predicted component of type VI protein secretion system